MPTFTKLEADEAESIYIKPPMYWEKAEEAEIQNYAYYLVLTNGGEWRDSDLFVTKGIMVKHWLRPEMVRGRPKWIARINRPREVL